MAVIKKRGPESFPTLSRVPYNPPPSASAASYAAVASGRAGALSSKVGPYLSMVLDPHSKDKGCRYPDETIVPTGLVHLAYSNTYTVANGESTLRTYLRWKCDIDNAGGVNTSPILLPDAVGAAFNSVDYGSPKRPGRICRLSTAPSLLGYASD